MKLYSLIGLFLLSLALSSCASRVNNAEELTIPLIRAIQHDNFKKIEHMLPKVNDMYGLYEGNAGEMGHIFYNKYSRSYRREDLIANLYTDLDIVKERSKTNDLDWDNVGLGGVTKEDITGDGMNYTRVTANLLFPDGGPYQLSYNAVQYKGAWYLLDDIYFAKQAAQ